MYMQPCVMRVRLPYESGSTKLLTLHPASRVSVSSTGKQRVLFTVTCSIPARDVVLDFGKYRGCRMGTVPSRYLRWLIRESHQASLSVWGDYAKQVLEDPHYKDRLEWQSIEKLTARGGMQKDGPLAASAGVKGSMSALGWDLSDHNAWSKVNFSLLGTTAGGRIPRKKLDQSLSIPKPSIRKSKTILPKPAASDNDTVSRSAAVKLNPSVSSIKSTSTTSSKIMGKTCSTGDSQPIQTLTLQEELLRRRQLRKERSASKSSSVLPLAAENRKNLFPGRDSLVRRARKKADT